MSFSSQPQLLQGSYLLGRQEKRARHLQSNLNRAANTNNIIEPFNNSCSDKLYSSCSLPECKRYGYCPLNPNALSPEKDAPPIDIKAFNNNVANFYNTAQKYLSNVQNYVNTPLTGNEGQNVIVSQLTGLPISDPNAHPCVPNPCGTGQTCTATANNTDYFCGEWGSGGPSGSPGLGPGGDTALCSKNPCKNGGQCSVKGGSYTCQCPTGWGGPNCGLSTAPALAPTTFDPCASSPCGAHGTCSAVNGAATCVCTDNYTGTNCSTAPAPPPDPCASKPCGAYGTCSAVNGAATCACINNYTGPYCQIAPTPAPPSNGGGGSAPTSCNGQTGCKIVGDTEWSGIGDPDGRSGKNAASTLAAYRPDNTKLWGQDASGTCPTAPLTHGSLGAADSLARSWPCMPQDKIPKTFVGADDSTYSPSSPSAGGWPPGSWFGGCHYKRDDPKIIAALNNDAYHNSQFPSPPPFVTGSDIPKWVKPPCSTGLCSQVLGILGAYSGINNRCGGVGLNAHGSWEQNGYNTYSLCNAGSGPGAAPGQHAGSRPIDASTCQAWDCSTWETDRAMAIKDNNMIIALSGVGGSIPHMYGPPTIFGTNTGWWRGDGGRKTKGQWNSGCTPFNEYEVGADGGDGTGAAIPEYIKAGDKCCCFTDGNAPDKGSICNPQLGGFSQA